MACAPARRDTRACSRREAASRVRELEVALAQLKVLEQERAEAWREAAHDLRGRAHVIANASAVLTRDGRAGAISNAFFRDAEDWVCSRSTSCSADLMDQARLEAGHERRQITHFDVASAAQGVLRFHASAGGREKSVPGCEGPATLMVDGDAERFSASCKTSCSMRSRSPRRAASR